MKDAVGKWDDPAWEKGMFDLGVEQVGEGIEMSLDLFRQSSVRRFSLRPDTDTDTGGEVVRTLRLSLLCRKKEMGRKIHGTRGMRAVYEDFWRQARLRRLCFSSITEAVRTSEPVKLAASARGTLKRTSVRN